MSRRSSGGESTAVLFGVAVTLLLAWLAFQATKLVARTIAAHPDNRYLRLTAGAATIAVLASLVTLGSLPALNLVAGVALGALVFTAWAVDTHYDALFKRALTRERLVHEVLGPWW